jgi:S1-C subfamily serine protease
MQPSVIAMLCVLLVAGCPAHAAEPVHPDPLITLTLQDADLAAAAASLSALSGRPIEVTNDVATLPGPDISLSQMPFSKAFRTLADAYRVCSVVRPTLKFQTCTGADAPPKGTLGLIIGSQGASDAPRAGAQIILVLSNSIARRAGVRQNDWILSFNGRPIEVAADLPEAVSKVSPGTAVAIEVMRGDQRLSLTAQF